MTAPTPAPAPASAPPSSLDLRAGGRRTLALARANLLLMVRNRLTLAYGFVLPLLPLALLLAGGADEVGPAAASVISVVMLALLFPVYYNVLSMIVSRRDELVLKRFRTGETRDLELLIAVALPGIAVALVVSVAAAPLAMTLGAETPLNPLLLLLGIAVACVMFSALAVWTAAWTQNAEAAQMTSMPVIALAVAGQLGIALPDDARQWTDLTPGGAVTQLVRSCWFGLERTGTDPTLSFGETWGAAAVPLLAIAAWTALAAWLARRSMQWEPRS